MSDGKRGPQNSLRTKRSQLVTARPKFRGRSETDFPYRTFDYHCQVGRAP
jgi:hypothetical protein